MPAYSAVGGAPVIGSLSGGGSVAFSLFGGGLCTHFSVHFILLA